MLGRAVTIIALAVGAGLFLVDRQSDAANSPGDGIVKVHQAGAPDVDVRAISASARENQRAARGRRQELDPALRPPRHYEIIYLGSEACPACRRWEVEQYVDWRRDPLRHKVRVRMAEVERFAVNRGVSGENFGRYHRIYERAFRDRRFAFPAFVLMDGRDIVRAGTGAGTWERFVRMARDEERYAEELDEYFRTHPNVQKPW